MVIIGNMHTEILELMENAIESIKYNTLTIKRIYKDKIVSKYYVCNIAEWNWFLNRYFPKAELTCESIHYIKN